MCRFFGHPGTAPKKAVMRGGPLPTKLQVPITLHDIHPRPRVRNAQVAHDTLPVESNIDAPVPVDHVLVQQIEEAEIFTGYVSEFEEEDEDYSSHDDDDEFADPSDNSRAQLESQPTPKRRKLDLPARDASRILKETRRKELEAGLKAIQKLIIAKKTRFEAGANGLQVTRARAIESHLLMMVKHNRKTMDASARASEALGFSPRYGARLVRIWVRDWLQHRRLPQSFRGRHVKSYSLLDDPNVVRELNSYMRSNKWSMNPSKLAEFTKNNIITPQAKEYLKNVVDHEMPNGLRKYLQLELFPRTGLKVGRTISLPTARRWLHRYGWKYMQHKKALFYDGHERHDVVDNRQNTFLPRMNELRPRFVEYVVGDVDKRVDKGEDPPLGPDGRWLVLCAHDEMTAQANDGQKASWVLDGEQPIRKKGVGRGIHQSDVICSTVGWLKDASQSIEYGKNYDGYWNGQLFEKQVRSSFIAIFIATFDSNVHPSR
jgi:hypothetical protein